MVHPVTGMSEEQILWELPLARGMAYFHAAMLKNGVDCHWFATEEDETIKKARQLIEQRKASR